MDKVETPREAYISNLIGAELTPVNFAIYKLIRENPLLQNYSSDRVKGFISFVHDKGGAGTSTVTINSAIAFAERGFDVYLLDINPQNPSMNEVTRPIRKGKVVVLYNNGRRIDAGKLDPRRVDRNDVFAVNSVDEISPKNRTIDTVIVEKSAYDATNTNFFDILAGKGITVYYFEETEESSRKYYTAILDGTKDHGRADSAVGTSLEELIGLVAPRTNKMKNLLNTHLDRLKKNPDLVNTYFSSTLVPGLYVLPTESNTFNDTESEQLSSRINVVLERLKTDVQDTIIRSIDFKQLVESINEGTNGMGAEQKVPVIESIVSDYVKQTIARLHGAGTIKDKILIADTSSNYNVVLDTANMSEPIIVMSPEETAIREIKGLVSKLRHARFKNLLEAYRDDADVSDSVKRDLGVLVERYLLPDGELRKINKAADLISEVDGIFQREAVEEILDAAEKMGKTDEILPSFISKAIMGEKNAYGFQSELKSINKRKVMKYNLKKNSDEQVFYLMKGNAKRIEDRIGKEIKVYESQRKPIDEKQFFSSLEQAIDRKLYEEIKKFYAGRKGNKYEAIDFILKLKEMGYDAEIRRILKSNLTTLEKKEEVEGGLKQYGAIGGKMKSISDKDAMEIIRDLDKRYLGVEHVFTTIDKYKPSAEGTNGKITDKESFIRLLPAELKQEAATIFEKYQGEAELLKRGLDYGNQMNLLMSRFPEDKNVRLEAVSELRDIEDCKITIVGMIGKDDFVENAMTETFAPFKLLDESFRISINGIGELVPAEGSKTNAARDIDAFVENLLNGGDSCSLERFAHELAYERIQRDRTEHSASDEAGAAADAATEETADVAAGATADAAGAAANQASQPENKGIGGLLAGARRLLTLKKKEQ